MSTSRYIHARHLFPPTGIEYAQFQQWKTARAPNANPRRLRYALEYHEFVHRNDQFQIRNTGHVAQKCGHELHPSDTRNKGYCPMCEVSMCLVFMDAIRHSLGIAGGPWIQFGGGVTTPAHGEIREGWHMARLEFETLASTLDVGIKHEAHWEAQWPLDAASARKANTSQKASQLALMETKYPAAILPVHPQHRGVKRKRSTSKMRKTVSFAPEVTCRADPNDIHAPHAVHISHEPIKFESVDRDFNRRSNKYEPGAHAAPSGQVWAETSFTTNDTLYQDLTNMKVFMADSVSDFRKMGNDPEDYISQTHYVLGCLPGADAIVDYVNNWSRTVASLGNDPEDELTYLIEESDALILLIESDQLLDIRFVSFPDVLDEVLDESDVADQGHWTSLRDGTGVWESRRCKATADETDVDLCFNAFKRLKMDK